MSIVLMCARDRGQWRAIVNTLMNLQALYKVANVLTSFSRRNSVSYFLCRMCKFSSVLFKFLFVILLLSMMLFTVCEVLSLSLLYIQLFSLCFRVYCACCVLMCILFFSALCLFYLDSSHVIEMAIHVIHITF
jgi:hypothetical protein